MSATHNAKHFWAYRNKKGQFYRNPSIFPTLLLIPALIFIVRLGYNLPAPSAFLMAEPVSIERSALDKCPNGVCDLTDTATKAKWEAWQKSPMAILTQVCDEHGIHDGKCPTILAAMARVESIFGKAMVGDGGRSHGYFHIMDYHNVPASCSESLPCSASWSLDRMIAKGYKTNWQNAVRLHNGSLNNPKTLAYLNTVKKYMKTFVPSLYDVQP